jgi:3'(2'), 5'-bisphosphate nucleotidase
LHYCFRIFDLIQEGLNKISNFPILSEEGKFIPYETRKNWEKFWLVDPIDGTKEFINKNDEFTVNIALIEKINSNYIPTLGVVFAPALKKIYWNDEKNAYSAKINNNYQIEESSIIKIQSTNSIYPYRIVGSRSHSNLETEQLISILKNTYKYVEFISMGSSLKLCLVAEGAANIDPRLGPTMEWDIAAAHAICLKADCNVYKYNSEDYNNSSTLIQYNKENLLNPNFIVKNK